MGVEIAIDAGQTGIKTRTVHNDATTDRNYPGVLTDQALLPQLALVIDRLASDAPGTVDVVTAGVSGLTSADARPAQVRSLIEHADVRRVVLAHDSTTSYLGALGADPGAVVAAGTGIVTLGVGQSQTARVDGWGNIMSDAGSGYWIGREALDAVMRAYDGRGPETALTSHVQARWPQLEEAYIDLQSSDYRVQMVAEFAKAVAAESEAGDPVAREISRRAGHEAALSVATALRRVGLLETPSRVCALGGVFRSASMHTAFRIALAERAPNAELVQPQGHGIDGAVALGTLDPKHPLAAQTWSAEEAS